MFRTQLGTLYNVLECFMGRLKGHKVYTIANLLLVYKSTEKLFGRSIEARILTPREQNKDDLDKVVTLALSHTKAQNESKLILSMVNYVKTSRLPVSNPESWLSQVLSDLVALGSKLVSTFLFPYVV